MLKVGFGSQAVDHGPNKGAIHRVERQVPNALVVPGALQVGVKKRKGQVATIMRGQIHHQKGDIIHHIDPTKAGIEFQSIKGDELAAPTNYIARVKIAMALPDGAALLTHAQFSLRIEQIIVGPVNEKPHLGKWRL